MDALSRVKLTCSQPDFHRHRQCAHCGCSGLSQADIRFPPRNKKADLRSRSAIYADCADSVQRLLPVVGVSFPASHFCKFCYDRDAAQSSKINICLHCFVTRNVHILFLQGRVDIDLSANRNELAT